MKTTAALMARGGRPRVALTMRSHRIFFPVNVSPLSLNRATTDGTAAQHRVSQVRPSIGACAQPIHALVSAIVWLYLGCRSPDLNPEVHSGCRRKHFVLSGASVFQSSRR
jgi:hypothetical protein